MRIQPFKSVGSVITQEELALLDWFSKNSQTLASIHHDPKERQELVESLLDRGLLETYDITGRVRLTPMGEYALHGS